MSANSTEFAVRLLARISRIFSSTALARACTHSSPSSLPTWRVKPSITTLVARAIKVYLALGLAQFQAIESREDLFDFGADFAARFMLLFQFGAGVAKARFAFCQTLR